MLQESVYCKLVLNRSVLNSIKRRINKNAPSKGIIQLLCVTEKQYASMEYISGQKKHKNLDTTERLIII